MRSGRLASFLSFPASWVLGGGSGTLLILRGLVRDYYSPTGSLSFTLHSQSAFGALREQTLPQFWGVFGWSVFGFTPKSPLHVWRGDFG